MKPDHPTLSFSRGYSAYSVGVPREDETTVLGSNLGHARDAPVEELNIINVVRAPARFRAFSDNTGIALKRGPAYVWAILHDSRISRGDW